MPVRLRMPADSELLVVHVIVLSAVNHAELAADVPAVFAGDLGTDDGIPGPLEEVTFDEELAAVGVLDAKVLRDRADDREPAFFGRIPQRDGDGVFDVASFPDLGVEPPGEVLDGGRDAVDGAEDQLQVASLGADDQVVAAAGLAEHASDDAVDDQDGNHQRHAERDAQTGERRRQEPLANALDGNRQQIHACTSGLLKLASCSTRSN